MTLSDISINRPVLAIVMSVVIVLFGAIGFVSLGVREYPSIDPPVITVRTTYAGANADVIEAQITEPLEKAINGVEGIRSISSASNNGSSVITVEFNLSANLEAAANDVRDKVSQVVRLLPQDIDGLPTVQKADANSDAILSMTLQSDKLNIMQLSDYGENVVAERLQTIEGVSTVQIWGQKRYAMRMWLDPARMAALGLTPLDVKQALDRENVELPAGKITGDNTELTIRTVGRLKTEAEFNNLIVKSGGDRVVRFSDIGHAETAPENEETVLKRNGVPMIGVAIVPQPGSNYIAIAEQFYKRYEEIKKNLPKDIRTDIALDNTRFVKRSVEEVEETLLIALTLVVLIIYLFFRDWLIAFRPLIDIPVSLVGTFFIMWLMGFSVNVLTLLGIVLATGLVVDDGIVVTENIFKKIEEGMEPRRAAHEGSNEIFFAVVSTSITLAAVFMPVIFLEGFVGRLFREFGVVVAGAVLISAFVSLTLTPMLNAYMQRKDPHAKGWFYRVTEPFFVGLNDGYADALDGFLQVRWVAFVIIAACALMIYVFAAWLPTELAPLEDRGYVLTSVTAPEGAAYGYTDRFMDKVSDLVTDSVPEMRTLIAVSVPSFAGSGATNTGFMRVILNEPAQRAAPSRSQQKVAEYMTRKYRAMPEAKAFVIQQQTISVGSAGSRALPVQYVIQAPNFDALKTSLPKFMEAVQHDPTFSAVDVNLKFNKPEINLSIDRDKARALGVTVADVSQTLQLALSGTRFGYYTRDGKQYSIIGQLEYENRSKPLDLQSLYVRNLRGELVQLDNVVKLEEISTPPQLYRYNRFSAATVSAGLAPGRTLGEGIEAMNKAAKATLDPSFSTALTGASRDFAESSSNIGFAFILALVLIYLVLAAQFESFIDPLIIMFTVPLALAGALLALWYFNQSLNIFSEIGIIMLVGLVTKNGILIVEFANQLREQGLPKAAAIRTAAVGRLRPILMTSLATALGALPIALALGAASKSRMSLGIVVIGGLLFSLLLTLYVIPAVYTYLSRRKDVPTPATTPPDDPNTTPNQPPKAALLLLLLLPLLGMGGNALAQTTPSLPLLTPAEAVATALQNNFAVRIARNDLQAAKNNNTAGNAGMLPTATATATETLGAANTAQVFSSGVEQKRDLALNSAFNAGVELDYTLFDGYKMYATRSRLREQEAQSALTLKIKLETLTAQVLAAYYDIAQNSQRLAHTRANTAIYAERVTLAKARYELGAAPKSEYLQLQADRNLLLATELRLEGALEVARTTLNGLLNRDPAFAFAVVDSLTVGGNYDYETLRTHALNDNRALASAQKSIELAALVLRETEAMRYPRVAVFGAANVVRNDNQAGFVVVNQSAGLSAGVTASYSLYSGGNVARQIENARLAALSEQERLNDLRAQIATAVLARFQAYTTAAKVRALEEQSLKLLEEANTITGERYRAGTLTLLELKDTQRSLEDAQSRAVTARYEAKIAETELLRLSGALSVGE